jgi:hypothetical protein
MSRPLKLALLTLTAFAFLCALCAVLLRTPLSRPAHAADTAVGISTARTRPGRITRARSTAVLSREQLAQDHQLATLSLAVAGRWQPPALSTLLGQVAQPLPSPTPDQPAAAPTGSYATFTANDAGLLPQNARVIGNLWTLLQLPYGRERQRQENVALIPSFGERSVGGFSVDFDSPGWYIIALHLFNPNNQTVTVDNTLYYLPTGVPRPPFLEDSRVIPAKTSFMVPTLAEFTVASETFIWHPHAVKSGGLAVPLVLQAITVDKL